MWGVERWEECGNNNNNDDNNNDKINDKINDDGLYHEKHKYYARNEHYKHYKCYSYR